MYSFRRYEVSEKVIQSIQQAARDRGGRMRYWSGKCGCQVEEDHKEVSRYQRSLEAHFAPPIQGNDGNATHHPAKLRLNTNVGLHISLIVVSVTKHCDEKVDNSRQAALRRFGGSVRTKELG